MEKKSLKIEHYNEKIDFIYVSNKSLEICLCSFGASIYYIKYKGQIVTIAPSDKTTFLHSKAYFGKTVGRTAGRIKNGLVDIDNVHLKLDLNEPTNNLHGGKNGLSFKNFTYTIDENNEDIVVSFKNISNSKFYDSRLVLYVGYVISKEKFCIKYHGQVNKDSILNITNHTYFNLGNEQSILNHKLYINSSIYGEEDEQLVFKNEKPVDDIMDFTTPKKIAEHIFNASIYNSPSKGYDHPYLLNKTKNFNIKLQNENIVLKIYTDYSGVTIYTMNYPKVEPLLERKFMESPQSAIAIEPSIFPSLVTDKILRKGQVYSKFILYEFSEEKNEI